jgi:hypothetical protein
MSWIGVAKNLGKAVMGAVEGDAVKVIKSTAKAAGHGVAGIAGIVIGEEVKETLDEIMNNVDEADDD